MRIKYKPIRTFAAFCSICNEQLSGNGSIVLPYYCKPCGVWKSTPQDPTNYQLQE